MELSFQDLAAIITLLTGFWIAINNRISSASSASTQAVDSVSKALTLREKDIKNLETKVESLEKYVKYLWTWIETHSVRTGKGFRGGSLPFTFDEFNLKESEEEDGTI